MAYAVERGCVYRAESMWRSRANLLSYQCAAGGGRGGGINGGKMFLNGID